MTVEIRTKTGLHRRRAGLDLQPTWSAFEVTEEQLEALRADPQIELRAPLAQVEAERDALRDAARALVETIEGEASGLRAELAQAQARIVELEEELAELRRENHALLDGMTNPGK